MNLSLLDPFQSDFPEVIEEYLEHGTARCIAFNRRGTLLAAGCLDGGCIIWDFHTRGVSRELRDKNGNGAITSVSWSKCSHRLLAACIDKSLSLWDVEKATKIATTVLSHPPLHARLYPGSALTYLCLACPLGSTPMLLDIHTGEKRVLPVSTSKGSDTGHSSRGKTVEGITPAAASFNRKGDLVFVGNAKGEILIVDTESCQIRSYVQLPGGASIRQIVFSRSGQYMLTNSSDRTIRVFENLLPKENAAKTLADWDLTTVNGGDNSLKYAGMQCLQLTKEFQDAVNRMHWKAACFNGDGEYVAGLSANKGEHKIHIWNRKFGQLARILEGPKESVADLAWHPTRPVIASVSLSSGLVYLWAKNYTENWSAFAPDFRELEENEEYIEKEDEFDLMPETDKVKPTQIEEDIEVDIMTTERVTVYSDSDDSENGLYFLPTVPVPDSPIQEPVEQPPCSPPKGQTSNQSESNDSPESEEQSFCEPTNSEKTSPQQEEDVDASGRMKRKRKPSMKAVEFEAELGRKFSQKSRMAKQAAEPRGNSTTPNKGVGDDDSISDPKPNGRSDSERSNSKKTHKRRLKPVAALTGMPDPGNGEIYGETEHFV